MMARFVLHTGRLVTPSRTFAWSANSLRNNSPRSAVSRNRPLRHGRAGALALRRRKHHCSLTSSTSRWSSSLGTARGCFRGLSLAPNHGPLRMQHDDDGTGNGSIGLNRTQRSFRSKAHPAKRDADEASGCRLSPERKAHRASFNGEYEITAKSLIELLPNAVGAVDVDDVCRQQVFLANLLASPYVRLN